jgi:hypothetical protein
MTDQFTEVTSTGYFQRVGGSIVGVLFGIVMVPVSVGLLYWNEGRAVDAATALDQGASQVIEVQPGGIPLAADGHLVHLTGPLAAGTAARDPLFGVTEHGIVRLQRKAEMYQWKESEHTESHESVGGNKTTEKTYTYDRVWSAEAYNSGAFRHPTGHTNPPMEVRSETFNAEDVKLGAYRMGDALLGKLDDFADLSPGQTPPPAGWEHQGDGYYHGANPSAPTIGDERVHFRAMQPEIVSVVAALAQDTLAEYRGAKGYKIALAKPGVVSAAELFREKQHEENIFTWILRGVGFFVMLVGLLLIAGPLSMVLAFLPFLAGIAETAAFLVALTLALPATLLVIAIAWITHRPVLGIGLLLAAGALLYGFRRLHKKPAPVLQTASGPTTAFMPPGMSS